jgi:hypothetical protein
VRVKKGDLSVAQDGILGRSLHWRDGTVCESMSCSCTGEKDRRARQSNGIRADGSFVPFLVGGQPLKCNEELNETVVDRGTRGLT